MPFASADVPTMLAMIVVLSLVMAAALAAVGWGRWRDGLAPWSLALLCNAVVHTLLALRAQIPDLLSIVVANTLLSCVFSGVGAAVLQFQGRPVMWPLLLAPAPLLAGLLVLFQDDFNARVGLVGLVCGFQVVWVLGTLLERRHGTVGRGVWLTAAGLALEAVALLSRAAVVATQPDALPEPSILQGGGLQSWTFFVTFTVVLLSSMGFVFMLRDRADEQNRVMAALDPLTGTANRRALISALDRDVGRAVRTREPLAVMVVDIDHFKRVNDQYGHLAGDQVLCSVVEVLRERVRAQDLVGRYGGEEFMVLLPDTTQAGAMQLAQQLCRAVEASRCRVDGTEIAVTVSIGVFGGRLEPSDSWDMLIAAADRALYRAKDKGRNRVEAADGLRRPSAPAAADGNPETLPASLY